MTAGDDVHSRRIGWFVIRARRVEEHSLAADKDKLLAWANGTMTVHPINGVPHMTWNLPPEELLDSLAARCRPFLLGSDHLHHKKVTDSLDHLLRGQDPRFEQALDELKEDWQRLDRSSDAPLGYESMIGKADGPLGDRVSDRQLAYTWVYCDLVHADDDAPERVGAHDIDSRFQAGTMLIASAAVRAIATLNLVRQMRQKGILALPDELFSQRINARPALTLPLAPFVLAPVGTPLEEMEHLLDTAGAADPDLRVAEADGS